MYFVDYRNHQAKNSGLYIKDAARFGGLDFPGSLMPAMNRRRRPEMVAGFG